MKRVKLKAKTFNQKEIFPEVTIFIELNKNNNLLPKRVYEEVKSSLNLKSDFCVISNDIEKLSSMGVEFDSDYLIEVLEKEVKESLEKFEKVDNLKLRRVKDLVKERVDEADEVIKGIDFNELSEFEKKEYKFLKFLIDAKLKRLDKKDFEELKKIFSSNFEKLKEIYFAYIKYLEDIRDERSPKEVMEEFERIFSVSELNNEEKAYLYYLKARNLYLRGEFLEAIEFFIKAKNLTNNEELLGNIYNSSANIFTDNLFFFEALNIANKALKIREELKLSNVLETKSLIAGIYLKAAKFREAYRKFKEVESLNSSRTYNYLAKSAIFAGYKEKAKEYVKKSEELETLKEKGFLTLIKMILAFYEKESVEEIYKETFLLPEVKCKYDKFVIGWGYTLLAREKFKKEEFDEGIRYLYKGIKFFLKDLYILEAYYVSLYPYVHKLPYAKIEEFFKLIGDFNLKEKFEEYVEKHLILKEKAKELGVEIDGKNNLKNFYIVTRDIDKKDFSAKRIEKILNQFSLI